MKRKMLSRLAVRNFQKRIYGFYRGNKRDLPWRNTRNPYHILVSEFMLQQTQVERVKDKYPPFIRTFPDCRALSNASIQEALEMWQGLGYNRRALALKETVDIIYREYNGIVPSNADLLMGLPGIGKATAAAIQAFAFDIPSVLIETNIRNVITHFFFPDKREVRDSEILPLIEETLDASNPREWYYAMMDYGAMLKKRRPGLNMRSAHYKRQTPFRGSDRQIRGMILKAMVEKGMLRETECIDLIGKEPERVKKNLTALKREGFLREEQGVYTIP